MKQVFKVHETDHEYWFDVFTAASAVDAAKLFVAASKKEQMEEIESSKRLYDDMRSKGQIKEPFEQSGFVCKLVLPKEVVVTPMKSELAMRNLSDERKYKGDSFDELWDNSKAETIRL